MMTSKTYQNFLLQGDMLSLLERLKAIPDWDQAAFDLVYMDPPFNVGGSFRARMESGQRRGRAGANDPVAYEDKWGGIDGFIDMLQPRIAMVREAMSAQSTLWLHLDQRTVHDAKVMCDKVFGRPAYRGEIIWVPGNGARGKGVPMTHQTILVYSKSTRPKVDYTWNEKDPALREPYADTSLAMHFTQSDADGRRYRERVINNKAYRYYADEGRNRGSVWTDLPAMLANTPLRKEGTGYPTQKPLALLERIVAAASNPGDLVLDPMCGSGTTLEAAAKHGRRFVGNDIGDLSFQIASKRLASWLPERQEQVAAPL
jgi:site-specific DNA-methyltransferase (adenine-specific)